MALLPATSAWHFSLIPKQWKKVSKDIGMCLERERGKETVKFFFPTFLGLCHEKMQSRIE